MSSREPDAQWRRRRDSLLADLARHDARRAVHARWITRTVLIAAVERAARKGMSAP